MDSTYPIVGADRAQQTGGPLYESLSQFLRAFSEGYPFPWALSVMGVVAAASLTLYFFWEVVLLVLAAGFSSKKSSGTG